MNKRKLHIWQVLILFVAVMLIFYFFGGLAQKYFGSFGVVIQQLGFLLVSVLFVLIMRADLREVFPIRKPKGLGVLGVLVIWVGVFLAAEVSSFLMLIIAPETTLDISQSMNEIMGSGPLRVFMLFVVSLMPAVCEEALHRGVILNGFKNDLPRHRWLIILFVGLIFGIFHLYPVRMLPTAMIGCVLTYLALTTNNLVYPALLHLLHNGLLMLMSTAAQSTVSSNEFFMEETTQMLESMPRNIFGIYISLFGALVPITLYTGAWIVRRAEWPIKHKFLPEGEERKALLQILIPTIGLVLLGLGVMLLPVV